MEFLDFFNYSFFNRALIMSILGGISCGIIGVWILLLNIPFIGVAMSHAAFAGAMTGLLLGINPVLCGFIFCVTSALFIDPVAEKTKLHNNISIGLLFSFMLGIAFLFTGTVLFLVGKLPEGKKEQVGIKEALGMGLAQTIAILPGVSRSGMTIASGLALGLKREEAAAFSFMMSIPVILGAGLLELKDLLEVGSEGGGLALVLGFGAAVLTGIIAINLVRKLLKSDNFNWFSYYLWGMGVLTIVISLI